MPQKHVSTVCEHTFAMLTDYRTGTPAYTTDEVVTNLDQLNGLYNAFRFQFVQWLDHLDRTDGWQEDGVSSLEDWATQRYNGPAWKARQLVKTMRALRTLPHIRAAWDEGLLCEDRVAELCSFCETEEQDAFWAERAQWMNYAQVRREALLHRRMRKVDAADANNERRLVPRWDEERSGLSIRGWIPGAEGAAVLKMLERTAEQLGPNPDGTWNPWHWQYADALVELTHMKMSEDFDADRATVVVHLDYADLNMVNGRAYLEDGPMVPCEIARRLSCDSRLQVVIDGPDGNPVALGTAQRCVTPAMRRELKRRDKGCVVCGRTRGVQAHHKRYRSHDGPTDMPNVCLLCWRCHRLVHDNGFKLVQNEHGVYKLVSPDGRFMHHAGQLRPEVRESFFLSSTPDRPPDNRPPDRPRRE